MILHYSLAILNTNDNALSLLFFANAPMSDLHTLNQVYWIVIQWKKVQNAFKKEIQITHLILELYVHCTMTKLQSSNSAWLPLLNIKIVLKKIRALNFTPF